MEYRRTGRGIAIVTIVWVIASIAALALATTANDSVSAQPDGCAGGSGSPSASGSASPSSSSSSGGGGLPSIPPSIPPAPAPDAEKPPQAPKAQRDADQADTAKANEPKPVEVAPLDPYEKVPVAAAQQRLTCKSTITIAYRAGRVDAFNGKVGSDEPMCKRARDVTIKKVKKGNDATVGKGATNARGVYKIPERNANGKFYALVAKSTTENDDGASVTCQAAKSRTIRV